MAEVALPRGIFTKRDYNFQPRQPVRELLAKQSGVVYQIAKFKYDQVIFPDDGETRKLSRACAFCFPTHTCQIDEEVKNRGIHNLYDIPFSTGSRWVGKILPEISYYWRQGAKSATGKKFQEDDVLQGAQLALKELKREFKDSEETVDKLAKSLTKELCDCGLNYRNLFKNAILRLGGWLLNKLFRSVFSSICVHQGEIELLERIYQTDLPIIFIPLLKSRLDPWILQFTLVNCGFPVPFFMPQRTDKSFSSYFGGLSYARKSTSSIDEKLLRGVKSAVTLSAMKEMLLKGCNISLCLESERSRTGKPSLEIYGIEFLTAICESFFVKDVRVEDVCIIPVSISYEKLPEFCDEVPFNHSTIGLFRRIWNCRKKFGGLGNVRVDFSQPFTLREYQLAMNTNSKMHAIQHESRSGAPCYESFRKTFFGAELDWKNEPIHSKAPSITSLYDTDCPDTLHEDFEIHFVDALAFHSIYAGASSGTIMGTDLVSFLLLKKFRDGTTLEILLKEVEILREYLINKHGKDVGFSGDLTEAVLHAIKMLRGNIQLFPHFGGEGSIFIKPVKTRRALQELNYNANHILPTLAMESVVATAIFSLMGNDLRTSSGFDRPIRINDSELMSESTQVYGVFSSEFFLHATCQTQESGIRKTFARLNNSGLLETLMDTSLRRNQRYYDDEDDDDDLPVPIRSGGQGSVGRVLGESEHFFIWDDYQVLSTVENIQQLLFLKGLITPYLEIYANIAKQLKTFDAKKEGQEYYSLVEDILKELEKTFCIEDYGELLCPSVVKSSLLAFEEHEIISCTVDKITNQRNVYQIYDETQLEEISSNILKYATW